MEDGVVCTPCLDRVRAMEYAGWMCYMQEEGAYELALSSLRLAKVKLTRARINGPHCLRPPSWFEGDNDWLGIDQDAEIRKREAKLLDRLDKCFEEELALRVKVSAHQFAAVPALFPLAASLCSSYASLTDSMDVLR